MKIFTEEEKIHLAKPLNDLHDSFKRPVVWYKENDILTISTDANFNFAYGTDQANVTKTVTLSSGSFDARIQYLNLNDSYKKNYPVDKVTVFVTFAWSVP